MRTKDEALANPMAGDRWEGKSYGNKASKIILQSSGRWLKVKVNDFRITWPSVYTFRRWAANAEYLGGTNE